MRPFSKPKSRMAFNIKFVIALIVMYSCFLVHYSLHESLLPTPGSDEPAFTFKFATLLIVALANTLTSLIVVLIQGAAFPRNPLPYALISIPQQLGLLFANYATKYVNYPTFSLLKSAKPIAVMICSVFIMRKPISKQRVFVVLLLTAGLVIFSMKGKYEASPAKGYAFAGAALLCDAIYVPIVDQLKVGNGGSIMTMFVSNLWSVALLLAFGFKDIAESAVFLAEHPEFIPRLALFGITGGVAQLALYYAIGLSDGLIIAIATTTRKFFTIVLSAIVYHHKLSAQQWAGIATVFISLGMEIFWKDGKKKEIKKEE